MSKDLAYLIQGELIKELSSKNRLLLALSGGPDSMFLFYILLKLKKRGKLTFSVAHVDHSWRKSSEDERKILEKRCLEFDVPFYWKQLPSVPTKNLEEEGRVARLNFFKQIYAQYNFQALLLAHHQNDRVETVLKKIFEGTSLLKLNRFQQFTTFEKMCIWRPLLHIPKEKILNWLGHHKKEYFHDVTNLDARFLRTRMRTEIIPFLEEKFHKSIVSNTLCLAEEAQELQEYVNSLVEKQLPSWIHGPWGKMLDLSELPFTHDVEWKEVARLLLKHSATRHSVKQLSHLLKTRVANAKLTTQDFQILIDRRRLFILTDNKLRDSTYKITFTKGVKDLHNSSWKEWWQGECWASVEEGEYSLHYPSADKKLNRLWSKHKIPSFLRLNLPLLYKNGEFYRELLTGKKNDSNKFPTHTIKLSLVH